MEELKKKLEQRKKIKAEDEAVEKAKGELVKCLRGNDRRPLDCWKEVEVFRKEVRRCTFLFPYRTFTSEMRLEFLHCCKEYRVALRQIC